MLKFFQGCWIFKIYLFELIVPRFVRDNKINFVSHIFFNISIKMIINIKLIQIIHKRLNLRYLKIIEYIPAESDNVSADQVFSLLIVIAINVKMFACEKIRQFPIAILVILQITIYFRLTRWVRFFFIKDFVFVGFFLKFFGRWAIIFFVICFCCFVLILLKKMG